MFLKLLQIKTKLSSCDVIIVYWPQSNTYYIVKIK